MYLNKISINRHAEMPMCGKYLRPMLPAPDLSPRFKGYKFPLYASLLLNGIRATVQGGQFMSSKLNPIPNLYLQSLVRPWMERLDGMLIIGATNGQHTFNTTHSGLSSQRGEPDVRFYISDYLPDAYTQVDNDTGNLGFDDRYSSVLQRYFDHVSDPDNCTTILAQHLAEDKAQLDAMETSAMAHGYAGLIARQIDAPYKHGRCTEIEGYMLKVQQFAIGDATVIGYEQYQRNTNTATSNGLGRTVRSGSARGKTPLFVLGALRVRDIKTNVEFNIGGGFTREQRNELWDGRAWLLGRVVRYKHSPVGAKLKPKLPIFMGFRDEMDA